MWILFLVLHLVGLVGYNLLLRKSLVAKADPWVLATVMQTAIALPMVAVLCVAPPPLAAYDPATIMQVVVTAGLVILLHFTNVQALRTLEAGTYSILYNLRIVFTTILGIVFLGEAIVPLRIMGSLLIFIAVLTLRQKGKKHATFTGIEWGVAASVVISFLNLFEKSLISDVGFIAYAVPVMLLAAGVMWAILLARGQRITLAYLRQPQTLGLMVFRAISAYGFTLAFSMGGILSVSTYISSLSVIIIVILGATLLGERDHMRSKIIATLLAVAGLTVIFIANLPK